MSEFGISRLDKGTGLKVSGEVDLATAARLTAAVDAIASHPQLTLDLTDVTFIDSQGVHSILAIAESRNGAGPVTILASQPIARVFQILAFDQHPGIELRSGGDAPAATGSGSG